MTPSTLHGRVVVPREDLPELSFRFPHDVLKHEDLSAGAKRRILSAWCSDAYAVESYPVLRHLPGTPFAVTFASIMDALAELDRMPDMGMAHLAAAASTQDGSDRTH